MEKQKKRTRRKLTLKKLTLGQLTGVSGGQSIVENCCGATRFTGCDPVTLDSIRLCPV
jgi:hypothetical protein